ncbi:DinB family protein [candidate division KSB1 bacterium]|nr:MAG: DinB family protein [candidate division KSB1 bacterium]
METVVADNIRCLKQGVNLLEIVTDDLYHNLSSARSGTGIGPHIRHTLDHYLSFLSGYKNGRIDYDARERDPRIENDPLHAKRQFERVISAFNDLAVDLNQPLWVKTDSGSHVEETNWSQSTLKRELQFLVSHTIHHYAIIAILLRARGFEPDEEFGVAPSTIEYRRSRLACAQ